MRPLFQLPATPPATPQTSLGFALSRSRYLPQPRVSAHMIRPENAAEMLANLPEPGHVTHAIIRGDFILNDLIVGIVRRIADAGNLHRPPSPIGEGGKMSPSGTATRDEALVAAKWAQLKHGGDRKSDGIKSPIGDLKNTATATRDEASKVLNIGTDAPVYHLTIGTLSMNPENARELRKLIDEGLVGGITMVISDYFFRTSRDAVEECFAILPAPGTTWIKCRSHVKIALLPCGSNSYVLHGSANLRSSANLENLTVENDRQLLDWHAAWISELNTTNL